MLEDFLDNKLYIDISHDDVGYLPELAYKLKGRKFPSGTGIYSTYFERLIFNHRNVSISCKNNLIYFAKTSDCFGKEHVSIEEFLNYESIELKETEFESLFE